MRWPATNNAGFILLSGTNLSRPAAWSPLGGPYLLNGGFYEYREPLIQSQAANFYRLQYVGVPATGPKLGCVLDSNALDLSWPSNFAGFNLESCTGLPPAGSWQTVAGPYPLSNGCFRAVGPENHRPSAVLSPSQAPAVTSALRFGQRLHKVRTLNVVDEYILPLAPRSITW